jgi:hypothetical protein
MMGMNQKNPRYSQRFHAILQTLLASPAKLDDLGDNHKLLLGQSALQNSEILMDQIL